MQSARVRAPSLHDAQQRMPTGGSIQAGIQRLIQAVATKMPESVTIYNEGVASGASFDDINQALKAKFPAHKGRFMVPQNVPYFRVAQSFFSTPGAAQTIMDNYAEDVGDGNGLQLYSFPVVFPSDSLDLIFREQFEAWKASELFRWSELNPESGEIMCMRRAETLPDKSKRRRWGGRPAEATAPCDPNGCQLFGRGECKHVGTLYFWVPGVSGVAPISLTFTSVYASMGIAEIIELVRGGLGSVKGLYRGRPIFRVSKQLENVSVMDWEKGKPTRRQQYIIHLEADGLDMTEMLAGQDEQRALPAPERKALPQTEEPTTDEPDPDDSAIKDLRSRLGAIMGAFDPPWTPEDLLEWLEGNGYTKDSVHDEMVLGDIITKLAPNDKEGGAPF